MGIPSVHKPIPEKIQLLMYDSIHKVVNTTIYIYDELNSFGDFFLFFNAI
jgi:hypothetical protein